MLCALLSECSPGEGVSSPDTPFQVIVGWVTIFQVSHRDTLPNKSVSCQNDTSRDCASPGISHHLNTSHQGGSR